MHFKALHEPGIPKISYPRIMQIRLARNKRHDTSKTYSYKPHSICEYTHKSIDLPFELAATLYQES